MNFKLTAVIDDETRKQLREGVLAEAKAVARDLIDLTVRDEVARVTLSATKKLLENGYGIRQMLKESIAEVVTGHWEQIKQKIDSAVEDAAKKNIERKLADKTVWEAERQADFVRGLIRQELRDQNNEIANMVRKNLRAILTES